MFQKKFGQRTFKLQKTKQCSCGAAAKLTHRRNYPFGRNSDARSIIMYRCKECGSAFRP